MSALTGLPVKIVFLAGKSFKDLTDDEINQIIGGDLTGDLTGDLNLPQRNNNPGNVKAGGIADEFALKNPDGTPQTDSQGHLIFPDANAGLKGLSNDLSAKINGKSKFITTPNPTLAELGSVFAEDPNWANSVASLLGVSPSVRTKSIDFNDLLTAVATQEGFFA